MFEHLLAQTRDQSTLAGLLVLLFVGLWAIFSGQTSSTTEAALPFRYQINLNTAEPAELRILPGIGEKLAGEIVLYRKVNGPIRTPEDLLDVKGIGPVKLRTLRPFLLAPNAKR